jgi:hypothetical protein
MSDDRETRKDGSHTEPFDTEIDSRSIGMFGVWLTVGVVIVVILMLALYRDFMHKEAAKDRPVSPLVDRTQPRMPPEPRLQTTPELDLQAYLAEEHRRVASYGWVDEQQGIVHIPVDRSMELLLEQGLPSRPVRVPAMTPAPNSPVPVPERALGEGGHR